MLGGVPASLGGGGLEIQIARTRAALAARGHDVFHVSEERAPRGFDLLHAFSSEPDVWHDLRHWRRNTSPLVVSPVCVVPRGWAELRQIIGSRLPLPACAPRMRVEILRQAQAVVALTENERRLIRRLSGRVELVEVIGNGVYPNDGPGRKPTDLTNKPVVLLGTVSRRKDQRAAVEMLGQAGISALVIGGFEGSTAERGLFEETVARADARWVGEVHDASTVRDMLRGSRALLHASTAEAQSLAVLEALAVGTPVILRPLPSNRELAARYPDHVRFARSLDEVPRVLANLQSPRTPPAVPTWEDVAHRLEELYRSVLATG